MAEPSVIVPLLTAAVLSLAHVDGHGARVGGGPLLLAQAVGAHLVTTAVSDPPQNVPPGARFPVTDTVRNEGSAGAGSSTTRYYLSLDAAKDDTDLPIGSRAVPRLKPGEQSTGTAGVKIPPTVKPGFTYFVLACANDTRRVAESSETNNCRAAAQPLAVRGSAADRGGVAGKGLVVIAVSDPPSSVRPGTSFVVTDTVRNEGPGPARHSKMRYYLSSDAAKDDTDLPIGGRPVPGLRPGEQSTGTARVKIPGTVTPGRTYFVIACVDEGVAFDESAGCRAAPAPVAVNR
jgi:hypothetical protein